MSKLPNPHKVTAWLHLRTRFVNHLQPSRPTSNLQPPTSDRMPQQNSAFNLMDGMRSIGVDLEGVMASTGAELHYVGGWVL